jgi:hypothetical protein
MNEYDALEEVRWQLEVALREIDGGGGGEPQRRSSTSAIPPCRPWKGPRGPESPSERASTLDAGGGHADRCRRSLMSAPASLRFGGLAAKLRR